MQRWCRTARGVALASAPSPTRWTDQLERWGAKGTAPARNSSLVQSALCNYPLRIVMADTTGQELPHMFSYCARALMFHDAAFHEIISPEAGMSCICHCGDH